MFQGDGKDGGGGVWAGNATWGFGTAVAVFGFISPLVIPQNNRETHIEVRSIMHPEFWESVAYSDPGQSMSVTAEHNLQVEIDNSVNPAPPITFMHWVASNGDDQSTRDACRTAGQRRGIRNG